MTDTRSSRLQRNVAADHLNAPAVENLDDVPAGGNWHLWEELLVRRTDDGVLIGVAHYLYTWGVLRNVDWCGYSERWCYHSLAEAIVHATAMQSTGEPTDFIRKACG